MSRAQGGTGRFGAIAQSATAVAAIGALVLTSGSLIVTWNQNLAQNDLTAQAQYTDRYTKAIEQLGQLGADRLQIRLGGIYALERLAHDSPRDQPTIIEVLSAFVRSSRTKPATPWRVTQRLWCRDREAIGMDIQVTLTVLGRRDARYDNGTRIDLHDICLNSANLSTANLAGADLGGVDFVGVDLSHADLRGADLVGANLEYQHLEEANLVGAVLAGADLSHADFGHADLSKAFLLLADLTDADLGEAKLNGANLRLARHDTSTRVAHAVTDANTQGKWW